MLNQGYTELNGNFRATKKNQYPVDSAIEFSYDRPPMNFKIILLFTIEVIEYNFLSKLLLFPIDTNCGIMADECLNADTEDSYTSTQSIKQC